ncbi:YeiH family protein [Marinobacter sp. 1_MG-2023]|uniref:YeiH family protein n=1 Tax=Marinobacter sp. 1_MG-2023 TaxID=3062627 RepID=UPI0026E327B4|nr:putative sulfate exporter family transporter [Marinobacter sp. 1_MG-2023]MDO6824248.1 putative sulfate exporter family transporter [Marinobacter sp. 1_MG-2023]
MWKGLGVCALLTAGGFALADIPVIQQSGISPLVFALLLAMLAGNMPWARKAGGLEQGLKFATRWLLRGGIVLFGFSITLGQILALGPGVVALDVIVMSTILVLGYQLGTRVFRLDAETALLTSAGSAICGAAAILATEATIRSKPAATSMAVATVVLFGSLAMLVYPALYSVLGWDQSLYGVYIGATVHEVAQVVAAGDAIGADALANAVIVKLVRVMLLVPFLLIVGQWWLKRVKTEQPQYASGQGLTIPWFAFGFGAMVIVNSTIALPAMAHDTLVLGGQVALAMAMAALGYETRIDKLRSLGFKPFLLALILFVVLIVEGMLLTPLLMGA